MRTILNHKMPALVLAVVLVVSIFTLLFAASISYKQIQSLTQSEELILHSYKVNIELAQLISYVKEAEATERGFILTNDSSFLQPYRETGAVIKKSFVKLKLLVFENTEQSKNLDTLFFLINQRIYFLETVLARNAANEHDPDSFKQVLLKGKELMHHIQIQADKMAAYEFNLLAERERAHEKDINLSPLAIWFIVLFSLLFFILAYVRINKDIKGLAHSNNQLLINKEIFEHSEQIANMSNWWWDIKKGRFTFSRNQYRLLGCKPYEFEPGLDPFIEFVHPEDRYIVREESRRVLEDFGSSVTYYRVIRKDGAIRHFKTSLKVISGIGGKTFIIGVNTDMTEQYNKDKMIQDKIADLEKSNKELSAFNHIASHDLQEPLRKVQIFISRIRENDFASFPEPVKDYISGIERATTRMQIVIEDLLHYSRTSNVAKIFEMTDLNLLVDNARQEFSQLITEKNVKIQSDLLPTLNVIPFQVQQLFNNLVSNSIKYSKTGVAPVIQINSRMVSSNGLPDPGGNPKITYCKISITDNGIGFDPNYSTDIFKLFYRLHGKTDYPGTGIGLAICKVIVENHKGFIEADGAPNLGATFTFYLPV